MVSCIANLYSATASEADAAMINEKLDYLWLNDAAVATKPTSDGNAKEKSKTEIT